MPAPQKPNLLPELVFGIVGPMGVNMEAICDSLTNALRAVDYSAYPIHLTKEMLKEDRYKLQRHPVEAPAPPEKNFYTDVNFKINYSAVFMVGNLFLFLHTAPRNSVSSCSKTGLN